MKSSRKPYIYRAPAKQYRAWNQLFFNSLFSLYFVGILAFSAAAIGPGAESEDRFGAGAAPSPRQQQEGKDETAAEDPITAFTAETGAGAETGDAADVFSGNAASPAGEETASSEFAEDSEPFDAPMEAALEEIPLSAPYRTPFGSTLKLVGTAVVDDPSKSMAIIENGGTRRQSYVREGDRVGGMRVKQILRNRIIVDLGGAEVRIAMLHSLPAETETAGASSAQTSVPESVNRPAPFELAGNRRPPGAAGAGPGRSSFLHLDRGGVEATLADIDQVMQQADVEPVMVFDRPAGVKVSTVGPGSIFAQLGLRSGDVIVGVNGESITRPEQTLRLLQKIKEGGEVTIQVKGRRRNRIIQLDVG